MKQTLIIGGGAAGMAAAVAAAQQGERVAVLERGRKPLKKLGVTGNGRGNLLNCGEPVFFGDRVFALEVFKHMPYESIAAFWQDAGVPLVHEDEGRMYPSSYLAASAVEALRLRADALGVSVVPDTRAEAIEKQPDGAFQVRCAQAVYAHDTVLKSGRVKPGAQVGEKAVCHAAHRVIVAAGGAASPMHGTDGTSYGLLTAFGHRLVQPRPALCALTTDKRPLAGLSGQRVRACLTLRAQDGTDVARSSGEALFAEDGVSGIAAMQLARFAQPGHTLEMDLRLSVMGDAHGDALTWLAHRAQNHARGETLLAGAASPALAAALWRMAGVRPSLDTAALLMLAKAVERYAIPVTGTRGFDSAQVTAGGIAPADFDPATMQSRLCPGLYAAGEMLDVDGGCGGYNLMFAVASGLLAGRNG